MLHFTFLHSFLWFAFNSLNVKCQTAHKYIHVRRWKMQGNQCRCAQKWVVVIHRKIFNFPSPSNRMDLVLFTIGLMNICIHLTWEISILCVPIVYKQKYVLLLIFSCLKWKFLFNQKNTTVKKCIAITWESWTHESCKMIKMLNRI